jgi:hypothetical protein
MKNIHILPTDKPSRLGYIFDKLILNSKLLSPTLYKNQNIYITDDSKIRERDWFLNTLNNQVNKCDDLIYEKNVNLSSWCKKIILTTDQDLIKDGVQAIDDEFLQWFIQNQSCEEVEIIKNYLSNNGQWKDVLLPSEWEIDTKIKYKIIIPQEELKQYPSIPLDCTHDIVTKYGVAECQNCGLEESKISKQLTDLEIAIKLEEIEREEPKQTDENGKPITYWGGLEEPKQETIEEFIFKVPFDYNIKPKEVIDMCMKEQENIILTFRLGNFIDMINSLSDDTEKNRILKSVFNNRDGELLLESYKSMKSHYEK